MKTLKDMVLLGDERLYQKCDSVKKREMPILKNLERDLHNVMEEIRKEYKFGRAIAAPQIGVMKRVIYLNIDKPVLIINPFITFTSNETFQVWDNCMSFPNLLVKVERYKKIKLSFFDRKWQLQTWNLENDLSELIQHEYDHLDGILSTMRAINHKSFKWNL